MLPPRPISSPDKLLPTEYISDLQRDEQARREARRPPQKSFVPAAKVRLGGEQRGGDSDGGVLFEGPMKLGRGGRTFGNERPRLHF